MATYKITNTVPFGAITTYRAIHAVEAVVNNFKAWNAKRQTYKQLSALSARELEDIGVCHADVEKLHTGFFQF